MSGSELGFGSGTDNQEADGSEAGWPSGSETALLLAQYSFEPSGNQSDSSFENTRDDSGYETKRSVVSHKNLCLKVASSSRCKCAHCIITPTNAECI